MHSGKPNSKLLLFLVAFLFSGSAPLQADEESDWIKALNDKSEPKVLKTAARTAKDKQASSKQDELDDTATINRMSPTDLRNRASTYLKRDELDKAIELIERSIELQPEDTEGRQIYADALEKKLKTQTDPDPHTFNQCIKQWYYLYKNAEYPEMVNLAVNHLKNITGKSPYVWPTAKMYLSRVLMPETPTPSPTLSDEPPAQVH